MRIIVIYYGKNCIAETMAMVHAFHKMPTRNIALMMVQYIVYITGILRLMAFRLQNSCTTFYIRPYINGLSCHTTQDQRCTMLPGCFVIMLSKINHRTLIPRVFFLIYDEMRTERKNTQTHTGTKPLDDFLTDLFRSIKPDWCFSLSFFLESM